MLNTLAIRLQLVCQLVCQPGPGNFDGGNTTLDVPAPLPQHAAVPLNDFIAFPEIGMAYKYFNSTATWNMARKTCIIHDSNLAVIDSFKKVRIVQSIRQNAYRGVWVGIHRMFGDSEWDGVKTGLPVPGIPWSEDRYNESGNDCLALWSTGKGIRATPCTAERNFVCEISLPV